MLPELVGPGAQPFDLRFTDPEGAEYAGAPLVLVSNNRYELDPIKNKGTRGKIDQGTLGVVVALDDPISHRWREWTTPTFEVQSGDTIEIGLDGEAIKVDPPLRFESLPLALRIRVSVRRHLRVPSMSFGYLDRGIRKSG